ncbi:MAG: hypothetical protein JWP74_1288 [Marmoricola sp.]|nr:hypothetical protein [Marmoricola sp.]
MHSLRLRFALAMLVVVAALVPTLASSAQAASKYAVTAVASASNATVGSKFSIHGAVAPHAKGAKVQLQVMKPGASTWTKLATATMNASSKYSFTVRAGTAGDAHYRVLKGAGAGHGAGTSPVRLVTAWRWRAIGSLPAGSGPFAGTMVSHPSVTLAGQTFKPGLIETPGAGTGSNHYADQFYALNGKCSRLDAWVSGAPTSATDSQSTAYLNAATVSNPFVYSSISTDFIHRDGDPVHIVREAAVMSQVSTLVLSVQQDLSASDPAAWGEPRVYCKF